MKSVIASVLIIFIITTSEAQKFWLTTYSFPGGPKTAITLTNDSCLFVGLTNIIIRSCDDGFSWDSTLSVPAVFTLFTTQSGRILVGSFGKIYYTDNLGNSWDSVSLNHSYPVTKIIQNRTGDLFAITGALDINLGFVGAGVFYSPDNGIQWTQRNNGLAGYLSCEQIAHDSNGRLYLAVADEFVSGNSGLFISDNLGLQWQHIDVDIDGMGIIDNRIKMANTFGLSVSPDDIVYLSISGTAVNVGVTLNINKSIQDITNGSNWKVNKVGNVANWWNDRLLSNIHFASNGNWYSSRPGSVNVGGTYFSIDKGRTWNQQLQGLGFDQSGQYNIQYFAENDTGKVYMVQLMDERIYWADTSVITSINNEAESNPYSVLLLPNPVKPNCTVYLKLNDNTQNKTIILTDILGKVIFRKTISGSFQFDAPETKGLYQLTFKLNDGKMYSKRLLVN